MLDIVNRLLETKKKNAEPGSGPSGTIVPIDKDRLRTIKLKTIQALCRMKTFHLEGKRPLADIFLSESPTDRDTILDFVESTARTEYRDGYVLGAQLRYEPGRPAELEDLAWLHPDIMRVIAPRDRPDKKSKYKGVGFNGRTYSCKDMDGKYYFGKNELEIHFLYITQRRDWLLTYLEVLAPRPRAFLQEKIDRLTNAIETQVPVEYF